MGKITRAAALAANHPETAHHQTRHEHLLPIEKGEQVCPLAL